MEIYFRDILLIRISRGANNCVQRVFEKKIHEIFSHFQLFKKKKKIKKINNVGLFPVVFDHIYTKGVNNSDDCICSVIEHASATSSHYKSKQHQYIYYKW